MPESTLDRVLRVSSRLALALALMAILGGGSTCVYKSNDDDDDNARNDDDDNNAIVSSDDGGASSDGLQLAGRIEELSRGALPPGAVATAQTDGLPPYDASDYALADAILVSGEVGEASVRRLMDVRGLSLLETWGPGSYGAEHFEAFAARVLQANPDLLALDPKDGALHAQGAVFVDEFVLVRWGQSLHSGDPPQMALPDAGVTFAFSAFGRLLQVENAVQVSTP